MTTPGMPDLTGLGVRDLLRLDDAVLAELRSRGLVRTNNKPLGDIAEQVVLLARGGVLEPNSTKSHDITTTAGQRIQVKAMGTRAAGAAGKFSPSRSLDFDTAAFLVFNGEWDVSEAWELDAETIARTRYSAHTNGRQPSLSAVRAAGGLDITEEMRRAWITMSGVTPP